jgi:hypothetical protein
MGETTVIKNYCGACRTVVAESPSAPVEEREPCAECGSTARHVELFVSETVTVREMVGVKARHGDHGKPFREVKSGDELHRDTGEWRQVHRVVDRDNDQYDEIVRRPDGTVVREVHEPLSKHRGRGAARGSDGAERRQ